MNIEIVTRPAAAAARIRLNANERLTAESGALIAMTPHIQVETSTRARGGSGVMTGLRRMFSGEGLFLNHFQATHDDQEVIIGPSLVGDIMHHPMRGGSLVVQAQSWLASSDGIEVDTTWAGVTNALFAGESLFWVKCSGFGDVLLNSFGAIYEINVDGAYTVDTSHIVAFEDTLQFRIGKSTGSWLSTFLSGEGLVCKFTGVGKLYCQTHNLSSFGSALGPMLKARVE